MVGALVSDVGVVHWASEVEVSALLVLVAEEVEDCFLKVQANILTEVV